EILRRGRRRDGMGAAARELEMVARARNAEHHAIEPVVVLEAPENLEAEAAAIHVRGLRQIADRPGDPEMMRHDVPHSFFIASLDIVSLGFGCFAFVRDALCILSPFVIESLDIESLDIVSWDMASFDMVSSA